MKTIKILAAAAVVLSMTACNSGKAGGQANGADSTAVAEFLKPQSAKSLLPSKAEVDSVSYLLGIQLGSMIKGYSLGDLNFQMIKKGAGDFVKAKGDQRDTNFVKQFKVNPEEMNRIMSQFIEKRSAYVGAVNKEAEAKFLEANKTKEGVQVSESGLQYIIQVAGDENKPTSDKDTVFVHYKLATTDGEVVEEVAAEQPSVQLTLNRVIPGWTEGMKLIGVGGKATLYVPSELGYGERGAGGAIQPNSTLVFDIQLDSVKHYIEPVPAE
jgi:FKBP-type peptidyl-prolyl cis-trans isomerase